MKLVVIGGVAGGASAAAKAKRVSPELEVKVFEKSGFVGFGACGLPYVLSGEIESFEKLVARTPEQFARQGIEVRVRHEVVGVDYEGRLLEVRDHLGQRSFREPFDRLVLATGASPVRPRLEGIDLGGIFSLRNIEDGQAIAAAIPGAKRAVIVGGGYIGLEVAEAFVKRGLQVSVVEMLPRLLGNVDAEISAIALEELRRHGVEVLLETQVTGFEGLGRVQRVRTGRGELEADLVLLALGVRPNAQLAESFGVERSALGAIRVSERLETNLPDVYAAGDAVEVHHLVSGRPAYIPLGDTANKQGRVAGTNLAGGEAAFRGVVGTAISKVFDLGVALTGLSELEARAQGFEPKAVSISASDHAEYYPDHHPITLKLVFEPVHGRLLGAQIAGRGDAVKRIDVVAALLHHGGTVEDLSRLDLAYAPPFSPVWDPLLVAANQAL